MSDPGEIIKAGAEIVKAVPGLPEALTPAAKSLGRSLETVAKSVEVVLAPVAALVWGYDRFKSWLTTKVAKRMESVPPECVVPPPVSVAGPAIEALKYTEGEEPLQDLYANLLASAMDKRTREGALPAFVEVIKQMTSDEARIMERWGGGIHAIVRVSQGSMDAKDEGKTPKFSNLSAIEFSGVLSSPHNIGAYLDNLHRLGLIDLDYDRRLTSDKKYDEILEHQFAKSRINSINNQAGQKAIIEKGAMIPTVFGTLFRKVCLPDAK